MMPRPKFPRLWPRSLQGQVLLAVALALLLVQGASAALLYRAQVDRREAALVHAAALRIFAAVREDAGLPRPQRPEFGARRNDPHDIIENSRAFRHERTAQSPLRSGEARHDEAEQELRDMLAQQGLTFADVLVTQRAVASDALAQRRVARRAMAGHHELGLPQRLLVAGVQRQGGGDWLVVRVLVPRGETRPILSLLLQTLMIYAVLVGALALILRRITRPLAALTGRLERFAETRDTQGQLEPQGPDDVRRLIVAHNAMEARIAGLLDEKDVMLGAIGHDLKTPLSALRVRIESVEDDAERRKMAATIEDITRSLDDILSLARVGRPSDPREATELSALVGSIAEEFEDMGEPVVLGETQRIVVALRATWLRRALRNLISNALRYGQRARVSLAREGELAVIRIEDDGPGIAPDSIARMLEPFTRGEPSRNSETGGAGLGLTLARAIAEQHGGALDLANRRNADGEVEGLTATLKLPAG
ncbi:MAG TPA: ATP-binding protein [Novosphingobium sp.]|nr:ATP-binding protein [Novosphingobium sp.]